MNEEIIPYVGEIRLFAGDFAPPGWAICDGTLLQISENMLLFSVIGQTYGGDGKVKFALPNLQVRIPVGASNTLPPNMAHPYPLGVANGAPLVALDIKTMPAHTHRWNVSHEKATSRDPQSKMFAVPEEGVTLYVTDPGHTGTPQEISPDAITASGSPGTTVPHNNVMPTIGLTYIIALQGIYPA